MICSPAWAIDIWARPDTSSKREIREMPPSTSAIPEKKSFIRHKEESGRLEQRPAGGKTSFSTSSTPFDMSPAPASVAMPGQETLPFSGLPLGKTNIQTYAEKLDFFFSSLKEGVYIRYADSGAPQGVLTLGSSGGRITGWRYASYAPEPLAGEMREQDGIYLAEGGSGAPEDPRIWLRERSSHLSEPLVVFGISRYVGREGVDALLRGQGMNRRGEAYVFPGGEMRLAFCPGPGEGMRELRTTIREWTPQAKEVARSAGFSGGYAGDGMRYSATGCDEGMCREYVVSYACPDDGSLDILPRLKARDSYR